MAIPGTLLPILQEAEWSGGSLAAAERLVRDERALYVPLVAYAYDDADKRTFLTHAALEDEGVTLAQIGARAAEGLVKRGVALRPRADGALVAIDEYASSLLAVPAELDRLRRTLGASGVLVAAPTRGLLVAIARPEAGDGGLERFARETFASALEARITPLVFAWDGLALEVHREEVGGASVGAWTELGYDEDEERLSLRLVGAFGPRALRTAERWLRTGRTDDGRAVASLHLCVGDEEARLALRARLGDDVDVELEPTP